MCSLPENSVVQKLMNVALWSRLGQLVLERVNHPTYPNQNLEEFSD